MSLDSAGEQKSEEAQSIGLVSEVHTGAVYHDRRDAEWVVDLTMRGVTLTFDTEEFVHLVRLANDAARYFASRPAPKKSA